MRVALAQINATLGDFAGNRTLIVEALNRAAKENCNLVVFPEHTLFGYLPNDLLERHSIVEEQLLELKRLEKEIPAGVSALVGCVTFSDKRDGLLQDSLANKVLHNSAALLERGKKTRFFHKERLPAYDVFDEARHLVPGRIANGRVKLKTPGGSATIQISICEDIWGWGDPANPMAKLPRTGVDLVINLSASPFTKTKFENRLAVLKKAAAHFKAPVVYVNMVGAQDEVLFDGRSLVLDKKGLIVRELKSFESDFAFVDLKIDGKSTRTISSASTKNATTIRDRKPSDIELLRRALVLGIRDFADKTGLKGCHFGLSGGIDSAVVACLAVEALGAENVTVLTLPGPFNEPRSRDLAEKLAENLGIRSMCIPIGDSYETLLRTFESVVGQAEFGLLNENLQARVRGVLLMALANRDQTLLLSTANKAELACGYSTLYGDQCGGLAPLGDLLKRDVYALAKLYNSKKEVIPKDIIDRAPSAELRPNQKDQDTLPPYDELDRAVEKVIEQRAPARTAVEKFVLRASLKSEFKRWQAPPILKVSDHAFGRGRRFPIAHRAKS